MLEQGQQQAHPHEDKEGAEGSRLSLNRAVGSRGEPQTGLFRPGQPCPSTLTLFLLAPSRLPRCCVRAGCFLLPTPLMVLEKEKRLLKTVGAREDGG